MIPPVASRFVAGETPAEALAHVESLNDRGVNAIVNLLGEHYHEWEPAEADAQTYRTLVRDIADSDLDATISVKPSQVGLGVSDAAFEENLGGIVEAAEEEGVFVWVDMEDHTTTDATLDAFERYATEYERMGVCVQANLKRTKEDVERLAEVPGKVRLVKGAYDEPKRLAYQQQSQVNARYKAYLEYMFEHYDGGVGVGSHDPEMIEHAIDLHEEHGTDFEFQLLMGVREDAQFDLADDYDVYQYVPYGEKWLQYFYRRVAERKENLLFAARAVLGR